MTTTPGTAAPHQGELFGRLHCGTWRAQPTMPAPRDPEPVQNPRGPRTGRDAARSVKRSAGRLRRIAIAIFAGAGDRGLTDEELAEIMIDRAGCSANSVRPRRLELLKAGEIEPAGTRPTRSGRAAVVYRIAGAGGAA